MNIDIKSLNDAQKIQLVQNRWKSSDTVWDVVDRIYRNNTAIYENKSDWLTSEPVRFIFIDGCIVSIDSVNNIPNSIRRLPTVLYQLDFLSVIQRFNVDIHIYEKWRITSKRLVALC